MSVPDYPNLGEENDGREANAATQTMDPELYKATIGGDILEFVIAMDSWAKMNRHDCLSALYVPLGPQRNTVLHLATSFRHHEIVKLLCKDLPALITAKDARGDTALHIAARAGDQILILLLIDPGSGSVDGVLGETNDAGNTPLHEALQYHHEDVARILIEKNRDMAYSVNKNGKSVMYLAAEAGYAAITSLLMENPVGNRNVDEKHKDKSPIIAAVLGRNIDVLKLLWKRDCSSFHKRCDNERNPLHHAAYIGFTEGVEFLLRHFYSFAYWKDKQGFFPVHTAALQGHAEIIQMMLQHRPDLMELLTPQGQNFLHIAAKTGKFKAFEAMINMPELEKLLNEKDDDGNTPLHIATIHGHPKLVGTLIWDNRVNLKLENNDGLTAYDIAEEQKEPFLASFRKCLTWMAFRLADAPRAPNATFSRSMNSLLEEQANTENFRDKVNVILLVATLVATVTFNAGFTMPGGYNNSNPNQGIASMLDKVKFQEFVICDSLAMYISTIVAVMLLWAQLGDQRSMYFALRLALPLLGIALAMMSIAFMAGVYVAVSTLGWLAKVALIMGSNFIVVLILLFLPLCIVGASKSRMLRLISYYPFWLMLSAYGNYAENEAEY